MFGRKSRYTAVEQLQITDREGREIRYIGIRFIPETRGQLLHGVREGERLDHIAHRYYRDPERFWRICDANDAMWPDELVEQPDRQLAIPPAEG